MKKKSCVGLWLIDFYIGKTYVITFIKYFCLGPILVNNEF